MGGRQLGAGLGELAGGPGSLAVYLTLHPLPTLVVPVSWTAQEAKVPPHLGVQVNVRPKFTGAK